MLSFFNEFSKIEQIMFVIAIICTALFVIQLIMLIFGIGSSDVDLDIDDVNGDGFLDIFGLQLLSVRGIIGALGIFAWTFLAMIDATELVWLSILIAIIAGVITLFLIAYIMKKFSAMENEGNIDINNCRNQEALVYLTIPSKGKGKGKVSIVVQERLSEFDAITNEANDIKTNAKVRVCDIQGDVLVVESIE